MQQAPLKSSPLQSHALSPAPLHSPRRPNGQIAAFQGWEIMGPDDGRLSKHDARETRDQDGDGGERIGLQSDQMEDKSSIFPVMDYGRGWRVFLASQL